MQQSAAAAKQKDGKDVGNVKRYLYTGDPRLELNESVSQDGPLSPLQGQSLRRCSASFRAASEKRLRREDVHATMRRNTVFQEPPESIAAASGDNSSTNSMRFRQATRTDESAAAHLPLSFVRVCAANFDQKFRLWADLAIFVPFLILFIFFVVYRTSIPESFDWGEAARRPATDPIVPLTLVRGPTWGRAFVTTTSTEQLYDWLERVVARRYWDRSEAYIHSGAGGGDAADAYRLVLGNQIPVGGLVVRLQLRADVAPHVSCTAAADTCTLSVAATVTKREYGASAPVRTDRYGALAYVDHHCPLCYTVGAVGTYHWSGNTAVISFNRTFASALAELTSLRRNASGAGSGSGAEGWFGLEHPALQAISVSVITYSPPLRSFARTEFLAEVPTGSVVVPSVHFTPFQTNAVANSPGYAAFTIIFFVVIVFMTIRWLRTTWLAISRRALQSHLASVWTLLELANLVALLIALILDFILWSKQAHMRIGSAFTASEAELLKSHERLEYLASLQRLQNEVNGINTVLFFLLILKYSAIHPTTERVTRAIRTAQESIVGLLLLLFIVVLAYALCGVALFGAGMSDFRNLAHAFSSLMRMLLGDSDTDTMLQINPVLGGAFFWSFLVLGLYLALNFIMAVVSQAIDSNDEESDHLLIPLESQYLILSREVLFYVRRFLKRVKALRAQRLILSTTTSRTSPMSRPPPPPHERVPAPSAWWSWLRDFVVAAVTAGASARIGDVSVSPKRSLNIYETILLAVDLLVDEVHLRRNNASNGSCDHGETTGANDEDEDDLANKSENVTSWKASCLHACNISCDDILAKLRVHSAKEGSHENVHRDDVVRRVREFWTQAEKQYSLFLTSRAARRSGDVRLAAEGAARSALGRIFLDSEVFASPQSVLRRAVVVASQVITEVSTLAEQVRVTADVIEELSNALSEPSPPAASEQPSS